MIVLYIILIVLFVSTILIRKDTKHLIHRSDELQKSLNSYIRREQNHDE